MGAKYGEKIDIDDMLPSDTAISIKVGKIVAALVPEIKLVLAKIDKFGGTTDMWTDNFVSKSYMALTVHYILNDKFFERVLAVEENRWKSIFCIGGK